MASQSEHFISGEEDEDVLFDENGWFCRKLKRKKWCNVKLLKHKESGKLRVVVREDQGLTIWLNHPISSGTVLEIIGDRDFTIYGEEMNFSVKFGTMDNLREFVQIFQESKKKYDADIKLEGQQKLLDNRAENAGAEVEHIITGEEDEDVLLQMRAKLSKFERKPDHWNELCVGTVKLLKHKLTGKVRLVMRSKSLNIYANLRISSRMFVDVHASDSKSCVWSAIDFSDKVLKEKRFCIQFWSVKNCNTFMQLFRESVESEEKEEKYVAKQLERQLKLGDTKIENVGERVPIIGIEKQRVIEDGKSKTALEEAPVAIVIAAKREVELEKVIEVVKVVDVFKEGTHGSSNSIEMLLDEPGRKKIQQYSHKALTSITENFSDQIGSGAYGDVFKGKLPNGVQVAVKKLKDNAVNVMEFTFMAEVRTMSSTLHRHLVILYGYCFEANMKALVYEYLDNGSFDKVLYDNHLNLPWEKLYDIAIGTAKGLSYLHEGCVHEIVHYDVKPGNVLLDSKFSPKIADFGMAKVSQRDLSKISVVEFRGTRRYAAPEMWMQMPATSKSDIYSFGMMLFEVLGRSNLDGKNWLPGQVWEKFKTGKLDEIVDDCGIEEKEKSKAKILATVALWCTQYRPNDRPPMSVVVQVLLGNIQLPSPPDPFYPYCDPSSASTWGGGSTNTSGPTASSITSTELIVFSIIVFSILWVEWHLLLLL